MLFLQALAFAMSTAALSVTAPTQGASIPQSANLDITWATVSTDSQAFNIQLALSTDSGNAQTLTSNVSPSTNGYSTPASAFSPGNYTINLVGNSATSSGVLAQSRWFLITAASAASSARASTSSAVAAVPAGSAVAARPSAAVASGTAAAGAAASGAAGAAGAAASGVAGAAASGAAAASGSAAPSSTVTKSTGAGEKLIFSFAALVASGFASLLL